MWLPRATALFYAALIALALWGCHPRPVGPPGPDGRAPTWAAMSFAQRQAHMRAVVLPRAAEIFQAWRPGRYARVECALCHGAGAAAGLFDMPGAQLPRLSGSLLLGPEFKNHPDTTRLKLNRLVPAMADALGLKTFSLLTRRGFGCYSCHLGPAGPMFGN